MVLAAGALYAVPEQVARIWPWDLTPLTARAMASWIGGLGLVFVLAARDGRRDAMAAPAVGLLLVGSFQIVSLARFGGDVSWGEAGAWLYLALLVAAVAVGTTGVRQAARGTSAALSPPATAVPSSR
jgi:hypothetical protein